MRPTLLVAATAAALLAPAGLPAQDHPAATPPAAHADTVKQAKPHAPADHAPAKAGEDHAPAHAVPHDDPIVASRPGLTEYTGVIAPGRLQLEGGYSVARMQGEHHHSIGEARFRFGIGNSREVRLDLNSFAVASHDGHAVRGYEDAEVGVKQELLRSHSPWVPSAAAVVSTTLPTGSGDFGAGIWQPSGALSLGWQLPEHMGVLGTVRYAHLEDHGHRAGELTGATTLSLPSWGPVHTHLEYAMIIPVQHREDRIHHVSGGYGLHLGHNAQLDMWGGAAQEHGHTEWLFGVGMSRRW